MPAICFGAEEKIELVKRFGDLRNYAKQVHGVSLANINILLLVRHVTRRQDKF